MWPRFWVFGTRHPGLDGLGVALLYEHNYIDSCVRRMDLNKAKVLLLNLPENGRWRAKGVKGGSKHRFTRPSYAHVAD